MKKMESLKETIGENDDVKMPISTVSPTVSPRVRYDGDIGKYLHYYGTECENDGAKK